MEIEGLASASLKARNASLKRGVVCQASIYLNGAVGKDSTAKLRDLVYVNNLF